MFQDETQLISLKSEIRDYTLRCSTESKKIVEDVEQEAHNLDLVEREAVESLKVLIFYYNYCLYYYYYYFGGWSVGVDPFFLSFGNPDEQLTLYRTIISIGK